MTGKHKDADGGNVKKIPVNGGHDTGAHGVEALGDTLPEDTAASLEAGPDAISAELEKLKAELKDSQDKYLRLYAETDNFKKRMVRESAEREKYYNEGIIKELLPVVDNLDRALAHAGEGTGAEGLVEGVRMVRKQLMDALSKSGVTEAECVGLPFDPAKAQAVMQVETDEYDEGVVLDELQKGYFLNERILRPAMVTVSKRPAAGEGQ